MTRFFDNGDGVWGEMDFPDVEEGRCCMGSAARGPRYCTCWRAVFDQPQEKIAKSGPMAIRPKMCADCAFRHDSPERAGDERYANSGEGDLEDVLHVTFVCHQGLRRVVKWVHRLGHEYDPGPMQYVPPKPPMKADGSPADYCAGWARERARRGLDDTEVG